MRRVFSSLLLLFLLPSCSFEWNDNASEIPLTGDVPALSSFDKLNTLPAGYAGFIGATDGAAWTNFCEFKDTSTAFANRTTCQRQHLVRLANPAAEELRTADAFATRSTALYEFHENTAADTQQIVLHRPGDAAGLDVSFTLPFNNDKFLLYVNDGGHDDVFVYWVLAASTTTYGTYRRDGKYQRTLPIPPGVDPTNPGATIEFIFTADGNTLVLQDPTGLMTAYSTLDESSVFLGVHTDVFFIDAALSAVVTFGKGIEVVPLDGSPMHVLTSQTIDTSSIAVDGGNDVAYYTSGGDLYRLPLDGSAAPALLQANAARLLLLGTGGQFAYSDTPSSEYAHGAGDGYVGNWQFMQRGIMARENADGSRIHFLEHAAQTGVVGDLMSVTPPTSSGLAGGTPSTLALNVHSYYEMPDLRILAIENHAYAGDFNRLVVIDEKNQTKKWVVPTAEEFSVTPAGNELIADVVSGASGYDILRVPMPAPLPAQ